MHRPLNLPTDRQTFEGEIATYWMDDGILVSLSKSPKRTVENIKKTLLLSGALLITKKFLY